MSDPAKVLWLLASGNVLVGEVAYSTLGTSHIDRRCLNHTLPSISPACVVMLSAQLPLLRIPLQARYDNLFAVSTNAVALRERYGHENEGAGIKKRNQLLRVSMPSTLLIPPQSTHNHHDEASEQQNPSYTCDSAQSFQPASNICV